MLLVRDGYTEFLLQIEIFLRRILVSAFGCHLSFNKAAFTEASNTAR